MKFNKVVFVFVAVVGVFITTLMIYEPAKAQGAVSVTSTGQFSVKVKGTSVSITRFEDQENKSVCYLTEVGSIACVKK